MPSIQCLYLPPWVDVRQKRFLSYSNRSISSCVGSFFSLSSTLSVSSICPQFLQVLTRYSLPFFFRVLNSTSFLHFTQSEGFSGISSPFSNTRFDCLHG